MLSPSNSLQNQQWPDHSRGFSSKSCQCWVFNSCNVSIYCHSTGVSADRLVCFDSGNSSESLPQQLELNSKWLTAEEINAKVLLDATREFVQSEIQIIDQDYPKYNGTVKLGKNMKGDKKANNNWNIIILDFDAFIVTLAFLSPIQKCEIQQVHILYSKRYSKRINSITLIEAPNLIISYIDYTNKFMSFIYNGECFPFDFNHIYYRDMDSNNDWRYVCIGHCRDATNISVDMYICRLLPFGRYQIKLVCVLNEISGNSNHIFYETDTIECVIGNYIALLTDDY